MNPEKFSINLLPSEILLQRQHGSKIALINKITVGILICTVFLMSVTLTIRFLQGRSLTDTQSSLQEVEAQVKSLSGAETKIHTLKGYLTTIDSISGTDEKRTQVFNLILALAPPEVEVRSLSVDAKGNSLISVASVSLTEIDNFMSNLSNRQKNNEVVDKIDMDGFAVGQDGIYRINLRVQVK